MIIVLSIYSQYADKIFSGEKTIELRKDSMGLKSNDFILLYETIPERKIRGGFLVENIFHCHPSVMWKNNHPVLGIKKDDYLKYYENSQVSYGIRVKEVFLLDNPLNQDDLVSRRFTPPQGFVHWTWDAPKEIINIAKKYNLRDIPEGDQLCLFQ